MSFVPRTARCTASRRMLLVPLRRAFGTSSMRALKESDRDNPDLAEQKERHKQDQLDKQKAGKGHWKPELASDSEEAVAADRSHKDGETIEEMQQKTKLHAQRKHEYGTSQDSGL